MHHAFYLSPREAGRILAQMEDQERAEAVIRARQRSSALPLTDFDRKTLRAFGIAAE